MSGKRGGRQGQGNEAQGNVGAGRFNAARGRGRGRGGDAPGRGHDGGRGGRGRGYDSGRGGRGRGYDSGRGGRGRGYDGGGRGRGQPYHQQQGGRGGRGFGQPHGGRVHHHHHHHQPSQAYANIGNMSCNRFISTVLGICATGRLGEIVTQSNEMWLASWRHAATLDVATMHTLLTALARLPVSVAVPPPSLIDVQNTVTAFIRHASDGTYGETIGLAVEEAKLSAVEVVEAVFQRLVKFVWRETRHEVLDMMNGVLSEAHRLLEPRYATHRKATERVSLLFGELDKPWTIRTTAAQEDEVVVEATAAEDATSSPWTRPTIAWLSDWNNFQPMKLPHMKVPGGRGDGVYDSPEEYFDTTIQLWTGMTFVDGHNALLPHCVLPVNGKPCDQPLWPMSGRAYTSFQCRTRNCERLVEYACANRQHHVGLCKPCAVDRQQKLRGPPSSHASTHIYDAVLDTIRYDGKVFLSGFESRRPPMMPIHWKTTRRLSSPNLVGVVLLSGRGASLTWNDHIYWAKVALTGNPRDEFREREQGRLALELLEYTVDETGNPLLSKDVEPGTHVAIIDCQTFVPEFIPVLKALERQRQLPMPFRSGALVNLSQSRTPHHEDPLDQAFVSGEHASEEDSVDDEAAVREDGVETLVTRSALGQLTQAQMRLVIDTLVDVSLLDPIVQIRRHPTEAEQLRDGLFHLVLQATLDSGQLDSFLGALSHPVHCTQGPPGTGKSYLGVVIVRALLLIRSLWMRVSPSVGEPPILVLSYKNHAIDEFLLDLVKAETSVSMSRNGKLPLVRIGGSCSEPNLQRFQEWNNVAADAQVSALTSRLDRLHKLATAVRGFRSKFSTIYEAQVLTLENEQASGDHVPMDAKKDSMKICADAAAKLAQVVAVVLAVTKTKEAAVVANSEEETKEDHESASTSGKDQDTMVIAAQKHVQQPAALRQADIVALYEGIKHYDPSMDPAEILFKWMGGFVPLPGCLYPDDACSNLLTDDDDIMYCKQHRCHFSVDEPCYDPVVLGRGFCASHLCADESCKAPVLSESQELCSKHACFICVRELRDENPARQAVDAPPRNTCEEHPLCWSDEGGEQCLNQVVSAESSYCEAHQQVICRATLPSGAPCVHPAISRSSTYCYRHIHLANQAKAQRQQAPMQIQAGVCAARTKKGKPCRGKAVPGGLFCTDHLSKSNLVTPTPPSVMTERPHVKESSTAPGTRTDAVPGETTAVSQEVVDVHNVAVPHEPAADLEPDQGCDDASSDVSDMSFLDAIDGALPEMGEEDYDEPEHIQHLRDVDELQGGDAEGAEFSMDEEPDEDGGDAEPPGYEVDGADALKEPNEWDWDMPLERRWQSIREFLRRWDPLASEMVAAIRSTFERTKKELHFERSRAQTRTYEGRAVIGGTITGCVTRLEAIRATKPFAVLVEEASEVLEPLLFACIGSTTCKLEMIGDHLQLQPSMMSKFDFERVNKINISMFERLIRAPPEYEVPSSVLSIQRRMRRDIADLTREFYVDITEIEDHDVCHSKTIQFQRSSKLRSIYPWLQKNGAGQQKLGLAVAGGREVPGVAAHLFFWTHKGKEEKAAVGLSRVNKVEAEMVCHLAKYLVDCGVPSKSIAILTPYKGQLMLIRKMVMSQPFGLAIRDPAQGNVVPSCTISTVDRFQGDEADVVIVSLVIDGKSKTPFVKIQNRMIVLLSRARIGMYIVGNLEYFTNHASNAAAPAHWQATLEKLSLPAPSDNLPAVDQVWQAYDHARIGDALPLCCPVHQQSTRLARTAKDVQLKFCNVLCDKKLPCTHMCGQRCHWKAIDKHTAPCKEKVESPCSKHPRTLECSPLCQSTSKTKIQDAVAAYRCDVLVTLQLPCTHEQQVHCAIEDDVVEGRLAWPKCVEKALTPFVYPDCKHERRCKCVEYDAWTSGTSPPNCSQTVTFTPSCGHEVQLKCYLRAACVAATARYVCKETVKIVLPRCHHELSVACPIAIQLKSWSGTALTTFGVVEEGVAYGPPDHTCNATARFRQKCGHEVSTKCSNAFSMASTNPTCSVKVEFLNPECGHVWATTCSNKTKLQQRASQFIDDDWVVNRVDLVRESDREDMFHDFGLGVRCTASVVLLRDCGHKAELPCHAVRSSTPLCTEKVTTQRPDCGHECSLPCSLVKDLNQWRPWANSTGAGLIRTVPQNTPFRSAALTDDSDAVQLVLNSGVLSTSLKAPKMTAIPSSLQPSLKTCKHSLLLWRDDSCGHEVRLPCEQAMKIARGEATPPVCRQDVQKKLPCGHTVATKCHVDTSSTKCKEKVAKTLACGHTVDVACHVDPASVVCKETVAKPCWNAESCHQTIDSQCSSTRILLQCDTRVRWSCSSGQHEYLLPICSKGEPTACPGCSYDALMEAIDSIKVILACSSSQDIPWPPVGVSEDALSTPVFAVQTSLSREDQMHFYRAQLELLERFHGWTEAEEDVWSRALFQPVYMPVFALVDGTKRGISTPLGRFLVKDFGSTESWFSIEVFLRLAANAAHLNRQVATTKAKRRRGKSEATVASSYRIVFGVLLSVGFKTNTSDVPPGSAFTSRTRDWKAQQLQQFGYDCAFFPAKTGGALESAGRVRVWEPFAIFPTGEVLVDDSNRSLVTGATLSGEVTCSPSRFITFKTPQAMATVGKTPVLSQLTDEQSEACKLLFKALPYPWAADIQLQYPWSGKPLLFSGDCTLPESVEQQMRTKLKCLRVAEPPAKKSKGKDSPFIGINFIRTVASKQPFPESELLIALETLQVHSNSKEALEAVSRYVSRKHAASKESHPLILVAIGRLIAQGRDAHSPVKPAECFKLFQELYPGATGLYLTAAEKESATAKLETKADAVTQKKADDDLTVEERWQKLKMEKHCQSAAMEELLKLVGLTRVKRFALNMFKSALAFQQMTPTQRKKNAQAMNFCFMGNPGTGKTTVAKLFAKILHDSGMRRTGSAGCYGAQKIKDDGPGKFRDVIKMCMGGVVFIDEAYELEPAGDPKGKAIVAELLVAAEEHRHDLSMILAGYEEDIQQKLYAYNDGIRSRFTEVTFDDFDEQELRVIWDSELKERDWLCDDKISTVACRRLVRGAGRKGFGNARAVRNLVEDATREAMAREDFNGVMQLRMTDVVGERPSKNPKLAHVLSDLDDKIGWKRIKQRVRELIDICDANYDRELNGRETLPVQMNRLFLGNPGTGKTTCASLYGKLLKHLGFLSNGDVVKKTASDFVGQYVGQSQTKTSDILKLAKGKVLLIDEAYNLNDNLYGKQVLDVLVEKVQGSDTDDIAVILIGYEHQMAEMLRTQNPGLARRFPIEFAFYFDDYDGEELLAILLAACKKKNVHCPLDVAETVIKVLLMQKSQANFGNAGAVEMLLRNAMANASKRPLVDGETMMMLCIEDIDNEIVKRSKDDGTGGSETPTEPKDPLEMLDHLYRMESVKEELTMLRTQVQVAEEEGEERPEIGHFIFRGSPGTGKTTVARVMGKILHHMGLLASDRVVETSGLQMTGEYVGQTKKKVEEQLGQARGAILFIDEAYELGKGHFGEEAMTTLVAAMTNPMYDGMVIIMAGYPADMDVMLDRNAGLKSRFTRFLEFPDWETSDCLSFMKTRAQREQYRLADDALSTLEDLFDTMRSMPGFGNGRDVDKVWKALLECRAQRVVGNPELERTITTVDVAVANDRVLHRRTPPKKPLLAQSVGSDAPLPVPQVFTSNQDQPSFSRNEERVEDASSNQNECEDHDEEPDAEQHEDDGTSHNACRDPGVSDDVWEELERAKEAYKNMLQDLKDEEDRKKKAEAQRKIDEHNATQERIRRLCKCPMGFAWNQVGGGWRCSGGSHYVSDAELQRNYMV